MKMYCSEENEGIYTSYFFLPIAKNEGKPVKQVIEELKKDGAIEELPPHTIAEKAESLAKFWKSTDPYGFRNNYDTMTEAIKEARQSIEKYFDRTIEIMMQDVDEVEDEDFTRETWDLLKILYS